MPSALKAPSNSAPGVVQARSRSNRVGAAWFEPASVTSDSPIWPLRSVRVPACVVASEYASIDPVMRVVRLVLVAVRPSGAEAVVPDIDQVRWWLASVLPSARKAPGRRPSTVKAEIRPAASKVGTSVPSDSSVCSISSAVVTVVQVPVTGQVVVVVRLRGRAA